MSPAALLLPFLLAAAVPAAAQKTSCKGVKLDARWDSVKEAFAAGEKPSFKAKDDCERRLHRSLLWLVEGCPEDCDPLWQPDEAKRQAAVADYRLRLSSAAAVLGLDIAAVEPVYCPAAGDRPEGVRCRLKAPKPKGVAAETSAAGGAGAAVAGAGARAVAKARAEALGFGDKIDPDAPAPDPENDFSLGGRVRYAQKAALARVDPDNPLHVEGKLSDVSQTLDEASSLVDELNKPFLERDWGGFAATIADLEAALGDLDALFKEAADPVARRAKGLEGKEAAAYTAAHEALRRRYDELLRRVEALKLEALKTHAQALAQASKAIQDRIAAFAADGKVEDLQAAVTELSAAFDAAGLGEEAKSLALRQLLTLAWAKQTKYASDYYTYFAAEAKADKQWKRAYKKLAKKGRTADFEAGVAACTPPAAAAAGAGSLDFTVLNFDNVDAEARRAVFACAMTQVAEREELRELAAKKAKNEKNPKRRGLTAKQRKRYEALLAKYPGPAVAPVFGADAARPLLFPGLAKRVKADDETPVSLEREDFVRRLSIAVEAAVLEQPLLPAKLKHKAQSAFYEDSETEVRLGRAATTAELLRALADRMPDSDFAAKALDLLADWEEEVSRSREDSVLHGWNAKADKLLGRDEDAAAALETACADDKDPAFAACASYYAAAARAQEFYKERMDSRTAKPGTRFYGDDLGLADGAVRHLVVAVVTSVLGEQITGMTAVRGKGREEFVSYDGAVTKTKGPLGDVAPRLEQLGLPALKGESAKGAVYEETLQLDGGVPTRRHIKVTAADGTILLDVWDRYFPDGRLAKRSLTDNDAHVKSVRETTDEGLTTFTVTHLDGYDYGKNNELWSQQSGYLYGDETRLTSITTVDGVTWEVDREGLLTRRLGDTGAVAYGDANLRTVGLSADLSDFTGMDAKERKAKALELAREIVEAAGWPESRVAAVAEWLSKVKGYDPGPAGAAAAGLKVPFCGSDLKLQEENRKKLASGEKCDDIFGRQSQRDECRELLAWSYSQALTVFGSDASSEKLSRAVKKIVRTCEVPYDEATKVSLLVNPTGKPPMSLVISRADGSLIEARDAEFGTSTEIAGGDAEKDALIVWAKDFEVVDGKLEFKYRTRSREFLPSGKFNVFHDLMETTEAGVFDSSQWVRHHVVSQIDPEAKDPGCHSSEWSSKCAARKEIKRVVVDDSSNSFFDFAAHEMHSIPYLAPALDYVGGTASNAYHTVVAGYQGLTTQHCAALTSQARVDESVYTRPSDDKLYERLLDDKSCLAKIDERVREGWEEEVVGVTRPGEVEAYISDREPSREERLAELRNMYSAADAIEKGVEDGSVFGGFVAALGVLDMSGEIAAQNLAIVAPIAAFKWLGTIEAIGGVSSEAQALLKGAQLAGDLSFAQKVGVWVRNPAFGFTEVVTGALDYVFNAQLAVGTGAGAVNLGESIAAGDWTGIVGAIPGFFTNALFMAKGITEGAHAETQAEAFYKRYKTARAAEAATVRAAVVESARDRMIERLRAEGKPFPATQAEYDALLNAELARGDEPVPAVKTAEPARDGDGGHGEHGSVEELQRAKKYDIYVIAPNGKVSHRGDGVIDPPHPDWAVVQRNKKSGRFEILKGDQKALEQAQSFAETMDAALASPEPPDPKIFEFTEAEYEAAGKPAAPDGGETMKGGGWFGKWRAARAAKARARNAEIQKEAMRAAQEEIANGEPAGTRVIGGLSDGVVDMQVHSDCAVQAMWGMAVLKPVRDALQGSYDRFLTLAERITGVKLRSKGVNADNAELILNALGYGLKLSKLPSEAKLLAMLRANPSGMMLSLKYVRGAARHMVRLDAAYLKDGKWRFVISDSGSPKRIIYSYEKLAKRDPSIYEAVPSKNAESGKPLTEAELLDRAVSANNKHVDPTKSGKSAAEPAYTDATVEQGAPAKDGPSPEVGPAPDGGPAPEAPAPAKSFSGWVRRLFMGGNRKAVEANTALQKRAMKAAEQEIAAGEKPGTRVAGTLSSEALEVQIHNDCAIRSLFNLGGFRPVRDAMGGDYGRFIRLAERISGRNIRRKGTDWDSFIAITQALGFKARLARAADARALVDALLENPGGVLLNVDPSGRRAKGRKARGTHTVSLDAAFLEDGVWRFVISDSNYKTKRVYTWEKLHALNAYLVHVEPKLNPRTSKPFAADELLSRAVDAYNDGLPASEKLPTTFLGRLLDKALRRSPAGKAEVRAEGEAPRKSVTVEDAAEDLAALYKVFQGKERQGKGGVFFQNGGFLRYLTSRSSYPYQGFKFHVSASPADAARVAELVSGYLVGEGVNHKLAAVRKLKTFLVGDGTQGGKFITVYPESAEAGARLMKAIDALLVAEGITAEGATIPPDFKWGASGLLTWRVGRLSNHAKTKVYDENGARLNEAYVEKSGIPDQYLRDSEGGVLKNAVGKPIEDSRSDPQANLDAMTRGGVFSEAELRAMRDLGAALPKDAQAARRTWGSSGSKKTFWGMIAAAMRRSAKRTVALDTNVLNAYIHKGRTPPELQALLDDPGVTLSISRQVIDEALNKPSSTGSAAKTMWEGLRRLQEDGKLVLSGVTRMTKAQRKLYKDLARELEVSLSAEDARVVADAVVKKIPLLTYDFKLHTAVEKALANKTVMDFLKEHDLPRTSADILVPAKQD